MFTRILIVFLVSVLSFPVLSVGQTTQFTLSQKETFRITGDSNVRAWQADIRSASGQLSLLTSDSESWNQIETLTLTIPVDQILSESNVLNGTMHNSLRIEQFPEITFSLSELLSAEPEGDGLSIRASGVVNAAGVDHPVTMSVMAQQSESGIRFTGSHSLLMSYFDIEPPTAMMGMFRADNEIEILFDLYFTASGL